MLYCLSSSRHVVPVAAVIQPSVGEWLSLVEHLVRDQGVGGSNPLSPTNLSLNQKLAEYENWNEPLGEYPGGQIRAPFVLIFLNTYGLSSEAIRL